MRAACRRCGVPVLSETERMALDVPRVIVGDGPAVCAACIRGAGNRVRDLFEGNRGRCVRRDPHSCELGRHL